MMCSILSRAQAALLCWNVLQAVTECDLLVRRPGSQYFLPTYLFLVSWCLQEQEEESEEVRVALLRMQYPQFPLETVTTALAAQVGQMHGAATLLQLQADAVRAGNTRQRILELVHFFSKPTAACRGLECDAGCLNTASQHF